MRQCVVETSLTKNFQTILFVFQNRLSETLTRLQYLHQQRHRTKVSKNLVLPVGRPQTVIMHSRALVSDLIAMKCLKTVY